MVAKCGWGRGHGPRPSGWKLKMKTQQLSLFVNNNVIYYMVSSASGQDEPNRALWLATRAGKMEPSCPLGTTRCIPHEKFPRKPYNKSFIDQVCLVKMVGYWPRSFFASLWTLTSSRFINTQKKNLANIQLSWPHTWSITHTDSGRCGERQQEGECAIISRSFPRSVDIAAWAVHRRFAYRGKFQKLCNDQGEIIVFSTSFPRTKNRVD